MTPRPLRFRAIDSHQSINQSIDGRHKRVILLSIELEKRNMRIFHWAKDFASTKAKLIEKLFAARDRDRAFSRATVKNWKSIQQINSGYIRGFSVKIWYRLHQYSAIQSRWKPPLAALSGHIFLVLSDGSSSGGFSRSPGWSRPGSLFFQEASDPLRGRNPNYPN